MRLCPTCGVKNADAARFCAACGAALESALGATTRPRSGAHERKTVSVMFVDLVGSTARWHATDPEDVREVLLLYHERLRREITRFGGTVEKFIGDAVMAVFGAPVAHEDDPERAVRAALRVEEAIEELNAERAGLDLAVRAAVHTGEAVVALEADPELGEAFVTGDIVNVASRLQGVAPPGSVVVGELTYRASRAHIEYEELEPVQVKGKEDPIPIWRALRARGRVGVDVETGVATPLIGRERELLLLQEVFGRTVHERTVQLVTLSGEPGIGKSRLTRDFRRFIDDQQELVAWRQGRCLPYGERITYWALGEIVKAHAGILENDGPSDAAEKLTKSIEVTIDDTGERDWIRARLAPLVGLEDDETVGTDRDESFAAWRRWIEAIAAARPLVLVVEDLHWADPALLAFVEHLAGWTSGVALMILCTARPDLYERHPVWGGGTRNYTAIALAPLSEEETARLIAALLEQAVLPSETQSALLARAGGNPLYAEEFVRMLLDRGFLVRRGAAWELAAKEGTIPIPESVHALIAARLDTLPAERKATMQDAAVIGKVFWAGAAAEMGGIDQRETAERLHELARAELIRPATRSSIGGEAEFAFWHVLIRDVAYAQIPRAARAAKHRVAASWIEETIGERVADAAELLVYHYEQAVSLAHVVGGDLADLQGRALRALIFAAERSMRIDVGKAFSYLERALALTEPGQPERLEVLLLAARSSVWGGSSRDEDAICREALEEARARGNELAEGEILADLSRLLWHRGETEEQFRMIDDAVRILRRLPPGPELCRALTRRVTALALAGHTSEVLSAVDESLPVVREFGAQADVAVILQFRGEARTYVGEVAEGIADLREGLRLARDSAPAGIVCAAYVNLGDAVWFEEGPERGQELLEDAVEVGKRRGATHGETWGRLESMWTRLDAGRWDELLEIGERLLAEERDGTTQVSILAETYRQHVLIRRGLSNGAAYEAETFPRARAIGDAQVLVPSFKAAAIGRLARGDADGGADLIEELFRLVRERAGSRGWLLDDAAEVCRDAGATDILRTLVSGYTPSMTRDRNSVLGAQAVLAELEGDLEAAAERYVDAAERWAAFPHALQRAVSGMGAGRCLVEIGRPSEAAGHLRSARGVFEQLRAVPLLADVDALLERATALSS